MPSYQVQFFKTLLSPDGRRFKCCQHRSNIDNAASPAEAIRLAWLRYDQAKNGTARRYADFAEAELIQTAASGHTLLPSAALPT
jgi:hypothetical protein